MRSFYSLCFTVLLVLCGLTLEARAQAAKEFAIALNASAQSSPAQITVKWEEVPGASVYIVRRRLYGETVWGPENFVDATEKDFVDKKVDAGKIYEYRVGVPGGKSIYGFITSGVDVPAKASEGTLLLLAEEGIALYAATEIDTYVDDLVRIGWNVEVQTVSQFYTPQDIKDRIYEVHGRLGSELRSIFLFGRVPIPYSGNLAPDGHVEDYLGAWPADGYYGDIDGVWTDATVTSTSATRDENKNAPGDGKFDQSSFPSPIELAVGRVDMRRMGYFFPDAESPEAREALLLKHYLQKNHQYRIGQLQHNGRSVISDVIGELGPTDIPAALAWRAFPVITYGVEATADWMNKLGGEAHHWAYGAGFGNHFAAQGVGTTEDHFKRDPKAIFTMLFGSRFGDWNSDDNLLRAPLGTSTGLATMWAGRPYWYVHQMAMGMTIGEATRHSQSASASYISTYSDGNVEMALMGDPTLRNHEIVINDFGGVKYSNGTLTWNGSSVLWKYFVARGKTAQGPFTPLTPEAITQSTFTDPSPNANEPFYVVRPVVEYSKTGSYWHSARGIVIDSRTNSVYQAQANSPMSLRGDQIVISDGAVNATLMIIDVLGRTVAERTVTSGDNFDISSLNAGAYIAQLRLTKGTETLRFNR